MRKQVIYLSTICIFLFISCGKYNFQPLPPVVKATIFGQVTDENGVAMKGVFVKTGAYSTVSDSDGIFRFLDIPTRETALVEFSQQNFFTGFKTIRISAGEDHYTRIGLTEKKPAAIFNTATGAVVQTDGNGTLTFPANSLVNMNTGASYNGEVQVFTTLLDPGDANAADFLPGANIGIDQSGKEKYLETFAVLGVELYDNGLQRLQVAPGAKVQISLPIPAALAASAPATIPLSYFDEVKGIWIQDGNAQLQGGYYVGEVNHFSFRGCHNHHEVVYFEASITDPNGNPLAENMIRMCDLKNPSTFLLTYTNTSGKLKTWLPKNTTVRLELIHNKCQMILGSKEVQTATQDMQMNWKVPVPPANFFTISGNLVNCNNVPLANAHIRLNANDNIYFLKTQANGSFVSSFYMCSSPVKASLVVEDISQNVYGVYSNLGLNTGSNVLGTLSACGNSMKQFISWVSTNNGVSSTHYIEKVFECSYMGNSDTGTFVSAWSTQIDTSSITLVFNGLPSTFGSHTIYKFKDHMESQPYIFLKTNIPITISRYDPPGGMIEGSFEGDITTGVSIPVRHIKGNFRVKRHN